MGQLKVDQKWLMFLNTVSLIEYLLIKNISPSLRDIFVVILVKSMYLVTLGEGQL